MDSLPARFDRLASARGPLCLGLDPAPETLARWGLPDNVNGLRTFCEAVIDAAAPRVAVIKPQSAFFERFGPDGMVELQRAVRGIQAGGALALIDAKRGDISTTAQAYGQAFLGPASAFGGDALTLTAYLGVDALAPVLDLARERGCGVFIVVRSSNPEGSELQHARTASGRTVARALADGITRYQAEHTDPWIGAVLGATMASELRELADAMPRSLFLCPGIGAQGASFDDLGRALGPHVVRALPSVSRAAYGAGPGAVRDAVARLAAEARRMVDEYATSTSI